MFWGDDKPFSRIQEFSSPDKHISQVDGKRDVVYPTVFDFRERFIESEEIIFKNNKIFDTFPIRIKKL